MSKQIFRFTLSAMLLALSMTANAQQTRKAFRGSVICPYA